MQGSVSRILHRLTASAERFGSGAEKISRKRQKKGRQPGGLKSQSFEVRCLAASFFGSHKSLIYARQEFPGAFAEFVLLPGGGEGHRNLFAVPLDFKRAEASEDALQLFRGAFRQQDHEL